MPIMRRKIARVTRFLWILTGPFDYGMLPIRGIMRSFALLAGSKTQRHIRRGRRMAAILGPSLRVAAHCIVAALIAATAQFLEDPNQRQTFTRRLRFIGQQQLIEYVTPSVNLR